MGLGPVILLGIAAGILIVEIQRWRGDRECPAGQRALPADGRLLFLARNTRRAERVGFAALLAEGATGPSLTQETCVCASIHPELSRTVS